MRANCERGISHLGGADATELSGSLCRAGDGEIIRSTRGLRAGCSVDGGSGTDGVLTGGFAVKTASAAWRALVPRSRSLLNCRCSRLAKVCSVLFAIMEFVNCRNVENRGEDPEARVPSGAERQCHLTRREMPNMELGGQPSSAVGGNVEISTSRTARFRAPTHPVAPAHAVSNIDRFP